MSILPLIHQHLLSKTSVKDTSETAPYKEVLSFCMGHTKMHWNLLQPVGIEIKVHASLSNYRIRTYIYLMLNVYALENISEWMQDYWSQQVTNTFIIFLDHSQHVSEMITIP